jgi:hypothetical protein
MHSDPTIIAHFQKNESLINMLAADLGIQNKHQPWFSSKKIKFHVKNSSSQIMRLISPWSHKVRQGILRQNGMFTKDLITTTLAYDRKKFEKSVFGDNYFAFDSSDKVMNSEHIVRSFENFHLDHHTHFKNEFVKHLDFDGSKVVINNTERFDLVFVCAGKGITSLCKVKVNTVFSMIGVFKHQVCDENFVIMDKKSENTLNCMNHLKEDGSVVSVFGDGQNFIHSPNKTQIESFSEKVKRFAGSYPDYIYVGSKSELQDKEDNRNYLPCVKAVEDGVFAITPGKFSNFPSLIKLIYSAFQSDLRVRSQSTWSPIYLEK